MLAFGEKNLGPPPTWQEQNVLELTSSKNTMNSSDQSSDGITRRNFMKNTALTVGAVTLLGQGIGLAAGTGSGSGSLSYLHISDTRTSDLNREIVVPRGEDITETISNVANALWEALGNEVGNYEIGNPNNYKSSTNVRITAYNQSGQVTANNTYTAFFGGPITMIKYRLEPV